MKKGRRIIIGVDGRTKHRFEIWGFCSSTGASLPLHNKDVKESKRSGGDKTKSE